MLGIYIKEAQVLGIVTVYFFSFYISHFYVIEQLDDYPFSLVEYRLGRGNTVLGVDGVKRFIPVVDMGQGEIIAFSGVSHVPQ